MQYGAIFSDVDGLACPHGVDTRTQSRGVRDARQQSQPIRIDALAREVEVEANGLAGKAAAAFRVAIAKCAHGHSPGFRGARLKGTPCGGQFFVGHWGDGVSAETGPRWYPQAAELAREMP